MRRKDLFAKLLSLRGHFAVITDNARFYSQISRDHIIPAINEANDLPIHSTPDELRNRAYLLSEHTMESAKIIQKIGVDVRYPRLLA